MNIEHNFHYIPYKSRRNTSIKTYKTLDLLHQYCYSDPIKHLSNTSKKINLEIGFGHGEFILKKSLENPDQIYLGCEVYNPGIVNLVNNLNRYSIKNVFIYQGDARNILINTPSKFFNDIYILFPDPWPKRKHHKRRLITQEFLEFIIKKFCSNLYIATDHNNYAKEILSIILLNSHYKIKNLDLKKKQFFNTKFESKAMLKSNNILSFTLMHK